jgi:adenylate cyclase
MKKLQNKFLAYILLPALLIMFVMAAISNLVADHIVHGQLRNLAKLSLRRAADEIDVDLGRGLEILRLVAAEERLFARDDAQRRKLFGEIAAEGPLQSVFMAFPDGRIVSSSKLQEAPTDDPRTAPFYKMALNSDDVVTVPPHLSKYTGKMVITNAIKVTDENGKIKGVLAYEVPTQFVMNKVPRIEAVSQSKGALFSILTRDGQYVMHTDNANMGRKLTDRPSDIHSKMWKAMQTGKTSWSDTGMEGRRCWFAGFQKSRFRDIYMAVEIPFPSAAKPLLWLAGTDIALLLASLIVLTVILMTMAKKIAKPIQMLSDAAERLSKGDYSQKLPVISKDELGDLIEAFNTMSDGLRQRDHIRNTFGRYVTEEVVDRVLESEDGLRMGGENREISMLMSDLRSFSALTADMPPEDIIALLNRYLGKMLEIIMAHNGIVDEITGDGILAFFGAPVAMDDHPLRAVACAADMQSAMDEINGFNLNDGLPRLEMGIGVNTGQVVVGNIGSEKRTKYGVVGSAINFVGRIEACTVGGQILLSKTTYERIQELVRVREVIRVEMKGFQGTVELYDVIGINEGRQVSAGAVEERPTVLNRRVPVRIQSVRGKVVEPLQIDAWMTHLSESSAVIVTQGDLTTLEDVRIDLADDMSERNRGEAFGKVVSTTESRDYREALVRFTYVPQTMLRLLREAAAEKPEQPYKSFG